jgi:hypothetical protein
MYMNRQTCRETEKDWYKYVDDYRYTYRERKTERIKWYSSILLCQKIYHQASWFFAWPYIPIRLDEIKQGWNFSYITLCMYKFTHSMCNASLSDSSFSVFYIL